MFFAKNLKTYAKVWKIERQEKYTNLKLSTSEKDKNGQIIYSNWYARAIGHAHNALANVQEGDRIVVDTVKFSNETKTLQDGTKKAYFEVLILDASVADRDGFANAPQSAPANTAGAEPKSAGNAPSNSAKSDSEDELPF